MQIEWHLKISFGKMKQVPIVRNEFHSTLINKFYTDETSMARNPQKNMYKPHSCEFHQTNNLNKFYTDETSMAMIASKEYV